MPRRVKTIASWLVVAFLVYVVVRDPARAGGVIRSIWNLIYGTVAGFGKFFASISS
jgi:hypothetical protein